MVTINARCESQYTTRWMAAADTVRCEREPGHDGKHRHADSELFWDDASADIPAVLCGARLTLTEPTSTWPRRRWTCALGPHDANEHHRAADSTQWSATDFPPTAPDDPDPKGTAALADLLRQRGEELAKLRNAIARTGDCICPRMAEDNDLDPLCPQHGTVAELVRQLAWSHGFTARIVAALPEQWSEPFPPGDAAAEIVRRLKLADQVDEIDRAVGAAGIGAKSVAAGIHELIGAVGAHAEHAKNCEDALSRIADLARAVLSRPDANLTQDSLIVAVDALVNIVTECERTDR